MFYVDPFFTVISSNGSRKTACHLVSDQGVESLHEFAQKIGAVDFRNGNIPKYLIDEKQKALAVKFGAKLVSSEELRERGTTQSFVHETGRRINRSFVGSNRGYQ